MQTYNNSELINNSTTTNYSQHLIKQIFNNLKILLAKSFFFKIHIKSIIMVLNQFLNFSKNNKKILLLLYIFLLIVSTQNLHPW